MRNMIETNSKLFWQSKTFWVNLLGIGGLILQSKTGYVVEPGTQATLLASINLFLRLFTRQPLNWTNTPR